MKQLTEEQMSDLSSEEDVDGVTVVEVGDWQDEGKYSHQMIVVQELGGSQAYAFHVTRSGSYFSDYDYQYDWAGKVEKRVKTTHEWVQIK